MRLSTIAELFDFMPKMTSPGGCAFAAALALFLFAFASPALAGCPDESYQPAPGFKKVMLSKYHPALKGTEADTPVFIQQGAKTGGVVLVAGGTHANEVSGPLAAVLFIEKRQGGQGQAYRHPPRQPAGFQPFGPAAKKAACFCNRPARRRQALFPLRLALQPVQRRSPYGRYNRKTQTPQLETGSIRARPTAT